MNRLLVFGLCSALSCSGVANSHAQEAIRTLAGQTSVSLSTTFSSALASLQVKLGAVQPGFALDVGRRSSELVGFPITTGVFDLSTAKGNIIHLGGLKLEAGGTTVRLTDFDIDTTNPSQSKLFGNVTVNDTYVGRLPLFDLTLPPVSLPLPKQFLVAIPNVDVKLSADAAAALNQVLNITALSGGIPVGTASVIAFSLGLQN